MAKHFKVLRICRTQNLKAQDLNVKLNKCTKGMFFNYQVEMIIDIKISRDRLRWCIWVNCKKIGQN